MQQFECSNCGYDMTGIERFSNTIDMLVYPGLSGFMPMGVTGLYDNGSSNTIACPNCGKVGSFIKH